LPHNRNQFLLLGYHKRLSKCPLLPKAHQQEALLFHRKKHHKIFKVYSLA
jgi:hypothetical protein